MIDRRWMTGAGLLCLLTLIVGLAYYRYAAQPAADADWPPDLPAMAYGGRSLVMLSAAPHRRASEAVAALFHRYSGAAVQVRNVPYADLPKVTLADAALPAPQFDVMMVWYPTLGRLAQAGALADLTDFATRNQALLQTADYLPGLYAAYSHYAGRVWGQPYDGDTHLLFYRPSLFRKHGLAPPQNWNEYQQVCETLTAKERANGVYGAAVMAYPAPVLLVSSYLNRLAGMGGAFFDQQGRPQLTSPTAQRALRALIATQRCALPTPLETDFDAARDAFLLGKVAMVEQWTDIGVMAEDASESLIRGDWDAVQLPRDTPAAGTALNGGFSLAIAAKTSRRALAEDFLLFASHPAIMAHLNVINGGVDPTRRSILDGAAYRSFAPKVGAAASKAFASARAWPSGATAEAQINILSEHLHLALSGAETAEAALAATQSQWERILSGAAVP